MVNATANATLDALGNPTRRQILVLLKGGPRSVGEIAEEFPISRPAISKHLRQLERAGLVSHTASGTRNIFTIEPGGFEQARRWLDDFWDDALARFKLVAENTDEEPQP